MFCIFCKHPDTEVIETRVSDDGVTVRRRRSCLACTKRFTTYERIEDVPVFVIKRDGRREQFMRHKLKEGLVKGVGKTNVTAQQIKEIVDEITALVTEEKSGEISSKDIGKLVLARLREIDKVAYIRFISVFERYGSLDEFRAVLAKL